MLMKWRLQIKQYILYDITELYFYVIFRIFNNKI